MVDNPNGVAGRISLDINDDVIWNNQELLEFLVKYQGQVIDIEIPEGACLQSLGLFNLLDEFSFKSVAIRTFNIVQEPHGNYKIHNHHLAFRYFNVSPATDYSQYHTWNEQYVFGAFYNRPTWTRIGLASYLHTHYQQQTILNFRFDPSNADQRKLFDLAQLFSMHPESVKNFMNVYNNFPIQLEAVDSYTVGGTTGMHTDQLSQFYPEFLIDVVAETFLKGRSFYPTEKTTRPMLLKKPFILMGPKCFLIHLRQMGFRTFHEFWDEDYDGHDMDQRYTRILNLIDSLAKKSTDELQDMYQRMQPILDHNYQLLIDKKFTREINYVR